MIKIISFDFWNTLFLGNDESAKKRTEYRVEVIYNFAISKNIILEKSNIKKSIIKAWNYFEYIWLNLNRTLTTKELILFILNELSIKNFNFNELINLENNMASAILHYPPPFTEKEIPFILKNLSKDYKLAIISDTGFSHGSTLRKFLKLKGVLHYFEKFSFSDELNSSKPDSKVYFNILGNEKPEHLLHVGDLLETDIKGAKNIGAFAVLYEGNFNKMNINKNDFGLINNINPDFKINSLNKLFDIIKKFKIK